MPGTFSTSSRGEMSGSVLAARSTIPTDPVGRLLFNVLATPWIGRHRRVRRVRLGCSSLSRAVRAGAWFGSAVLQKKIDKEEDAEQGAKHSEPFVVPPRLLRLLWTCCGLSARVSQPHSLEWPGGSKCYVGRALCSGHPGERQKGPADRKTVFGK